LLPAHKVLLAFILLNFTTLAAYLKPVFNPPQILTSSLGKHDAEAGYEEED
jgi:hypothetical protein